MTNPNTQSVENQLHLSIPGVADLKATRKAVSHGTGSTGTRFRPFLPPQLLLLPANLRALLPPNHFVFWLIDLVDSLDLSAIYSKYRHNGGIGRSPYHPKMMLTLILYGYCTGTRATRGIERKCREHIPCLIITGSQIPDHDTIANFLALHRNSFELIFQQVLTVAVEAGLVKLDHVAIDGSKIHANASRHKAMSYERMCESEKKLPKQIEELENELSELERKDNAASKKQKRILKRKIKSSRHKLTKIKGARTKLEKRARKKAKAEAKAKKKLLKAGKRIRKIPDPELATPDPKDQMNFTDPDSRIMGKAGAEFEQCYNAQLAVDDYKQIIVALDVVQQTNDKMQLIPMLKQVNARMGRYPNKSSADAGYFSQANIEKASNFLTELFIPPDRETHPRKSAPLTGRIPSNISPADRMRRKLATAGGKRTYARRKCIVEPVYGQIKSSDLEFDQFSWRGLKNVRCEWALVCTAHNLNKIYRALELSISPASEAS